jgi:hypothetical protein
MNTRKYPRTLNDAFPFGADYASAVTRPFARDHSANRAVWIALVIAGIALAFVL